MLDSRTSKQKVAAMLNTDGNAHSARRFLMAQGCPTERLANQIIIGCLQGSKTQVTLANQLEAEGASE